MILRYAEVRDGEVVEIFDTRTEIPLSTCIKKHILPAIITTIEVEEGKTSREKEGIFVRDDKVEIVRFHYYHVDTLEEVKEKKRYQLTDYIDSRENISKDFIDSEKNKILNCDTIESVNDIYYKPYEEDL